MASTYIPSDGTMHRFIQDNLIDASIALANAKSKRKTYGSVPVVVDSDPRHNKTSQTTISMSNYDQNNASEVVAIGTTGKDKFANHGAYTFIWGDKGNDSIRSYKSDVTISGGEGNDSIRISVDGFALERNSLSGGAGADTIQVYGNGTKNPGSVTIIGGTGNDNISLPVRIRYEPSYTMQYSPGDGTDFVSGWYKYDKLYIAGSYSTERDGDNAIVKVGSGSIKFKDFFGLYGGDARIDIETVPAGTFGTSTTSGGSGGSGSGGGSSSGATTLTVTDKTKSPVTVGSAVKTINASSRTKAVKITGNKLANTISGGSKNDSLYGGAGSDSILGGKGNDKLYGEAGDDILKGGAGNDTLSGGKGNDLLYGDAGNDLLKGGASNDSLWGGAGNDTLYVDAGADTFIYSSGEGKDVIFGFDKNDMLQITGTFSASYNKSKKEIAFKVGSTKNAITLKDFGSTSTFNVNGFDYKISGSKLVKK